MKLASDRDANASEHFTGINNVATVVTVQRHNHPGERIVSGLRGTAQCSSFARMSSMASRSIRG
jgi:hypothetical protein